MNQKTMILMVALIGTSVYAQTASNIASAGNESPLQVNVVITNGPITSGDSILFQIILKNVSSKAIKYTDGRGYKIDVMDSAGNDISIQAKGHRKTESSGEILGRVQYSLEPGQSRTIRSGWTPTAGFSMHGTYQLRACRWQPKNDQQVCSPYVPFNVN